MVPTMNLEEVWLSQTQQEEPLPDVMALSPLNLNSMFGDDSDLDFLEALSTPEEKKV